VREVLGVEPDAWQCDVLAECSKPGRKRIAMKACAGPGKAQPVDMVVETPDGPRRWGDLKPGDVLFALDGSPTKITHQTWRGTLPLFRVVFDDGTETLCCEDHLWRVRGRTERRHVQQRNSPQWTPAKERQAIAQGHYRTPESGWSVLSLRDIILRNDCNDGKSRRQFEIPACGPVQYPEWNLPLDPYVLGVWLGDGSRRKASGDWPDKEIDQAIRDRGYDVTRRNGDKSATVHGIGWVLRMLGLFDLGSHDRYIPDEYLRTSVEQRKSLLAGLMDTDGTIATDNSMSFDSTSQRLVEGVVFLARSLGGKCQPIRERIGKYRGEDGEIIECRTCYRVTMALPFNPFLLPKKATRWTRPQDRYLHKWIDRIEPMGCGEAMCVQVDHVDECYLCNDFIVTHNTALLAWEGWRRLACYARPGEHPKGAAVAITNDNLRDNLWAELAKWQGRSPFLKQAFTWTKQRIFANDHPETWFLSARGYSKTADMDAIGRTLSGLHSLFPFYLIDESGDIPPNMLRSAEQGLTSCEDGVILTAGNTTSHEGLLYFACSTVRDQWFVVSITADPDDPKRTPRVDKEWARQQIELYGRDNPWVQAFILGQFPAASINAILSVEEVEAAMKRVVKPDQYEWSQKRLGIDVARFGDDRSVIFPRQGLKAFRPVVMRHQRTTDIAARVAAAKAKWGSEVELIDDTGHWGHGVIDNLLAAGQSPIGIQFHAPAINQRYKNRRAEMWLEMAEWIRRGGGLPNIPELIPELTSPTYTFLNGKFVLEDKDLVKQRIGRSPDLGDGLALTFALPDQPNSLNTQLARLTGSPLIRADRADTNYNPFA